MRLLHQRHGHCCGRPAQAQAESFRGGDQTRDERSSLPLRNPLESRARNRTRRQGGSPAMSGLDFSPRQIIESASMLVVGFAIGSTAFATTGACAEAAVHTVVPESLDSWLAVARDGTITVFTGRVDLGTGTETVFAQ